MQGFQETSSGEKVTMDVQVLFQDNVMTTDTVTSDGYHSIAIDQFRYASKNNSEWLDPNLEKIGNCYCYASVCNCSAETKSGLKIERIIDFTKIGLIIHNTGSLGDITYESHITLRPTH